MLDYVQYRVPKEELAAALWAGATIIGTDGSVKNGHGTYAYVIIIVPQTMNLYLHADLEDICQH